MSKLCDNLFTCSFSFVAGIGLACIAVWVVATAVSYIIERMSRK